MPVPEIRQSCLRWLPRVLCKLRLWWKNKLALPHLTLLRRDTSIHLILCYSSQSAPFISLSAIHLILCYSSHSMRFISVCAIHLILCYSSHSVLFIIFLQFISFCAIHLILCLYPECPHRQCVGLAFRRSHVRISVSPVSLVICSPH